ncbi:hypothetical protein HNP83_007041 [Rhizobium leguminosarum]|nr:hypothetical protein [Rhizobium leguminosarum]
MFSSHGLCRQILGWSLCFPDRRSIEIDYNTVERTIRPIALNRKNALFAGHDAGAENWAIIASLIETSKLNGVDPFACLTATLNAIANGHKQSLIKELLPWNNLARQYAFKAFYPAHCGLLPTFDPSF